uniref:Uncharacterized protein n=1 Tax=Anguilla anguilla TaxID=7936 RepID=A0A0E9QRS2_ANGAN
MLYNGWYGSYCTCFVSSKNTLEVTQNQLARYHYDIMHYF